MLWSQEQHKYKFTIATSSTKIYDLVGSKKRKKDCCTCSTISKRHLEHKKAKNENLFQEVIEETNLKAIIMS